MADKLSSPIVLRAASLTLTSTLTTVVGTVSTDNANATSGAVALGKLGTVALRMTYTRAGGSATGRPSIKVWGSGDAPSTAAASVSNWQPVYLIDASSFSSGTVQTYGETQQPNPSATGASVFGTHVIDVSPFPWLMVQLADVDGVAPGAVTNLALLGAL